MTRGTPESSAAVRMVRMRCTCSVRGYSGALSSPVLSSKLMPATPAAMSCLVWSRKPGEVAGVSALEVDGHGQVDRGGDAARGVERLGEAHPLAVVEAARVAHRM